MVTVRYGFHNELNLKYRVSRAPSNSEELTIRFRPEKRR